MESSRAGTGCFPGGSVVKNPPANRGDPGSIPGCEDPGGGHGNPLQYPCLENPTDVGYSPWGHTEMDTTERLSTHAHKAGVDPKNPLSGGFRLLSPFLPPSIFLSPFLFFFLPFLSLFFFLSRCLLLKLKWMETA